MNLYTKTSNSPIMPVKTATVSGSNSNTDPSLVMIGFGGLSEEEIEKRIAVLRNAWFLKCELMEGWPQTHLKTKWKVTFKF
ncbi:hypothetical protein ACIQWQ_25215 [Peribacillus frigoritolerans]